MDDDGDDGDFLSGLQCHDHFSHILLLKKRKTAKKHIYLHLHLTSVLQQNLFFLVLPQACDLFFFGFLARTKISREDVCKKLDNQHLRNRPFLS